MIIELNYWGKAMIIYSLRAGAGDCFVIDFENGKCILIDGGIPKTYSESLKPLLQQLNSEGKCIENMICTHFDNDHIGGLIKLIQDNGSYSDPQIIPIENVLCNRFDHLYSDSNRIHLDTKSPISYSQQISFEVLCLQNGYPLPTDQIVTGQIFEGTGYSINVVAPSLEALEKCKRSIPVTDSAKKPETISAFSYTDISQWADTNVGPRLNAVNCASLAFVVIENDKSVLFCGDADMDTYRCHLNDYYDLIKLSHHGTYHGNECFIGKNAKKAEKYLISTHSTRYPHPELRLLAEIIMQDRHKELLFNYDLTKYKSAEYGLLNNSIQQKKYRFTTNVINRIEV